MNNTQEKKKVIKEELLQKMNPESKEDSKVAGDSASDDRQKDDKNVEDLPVVTLKNVLSADSAVRLSAIEETASHNRERDEAVLDSEIQSDEIYGTDTSAKKEALSAMRRKEPFTIESLHKKEDTSVPTMDMGAKIIIHE